MPRSFCFWNKTCAARSVRSSTARLKVCSFNNVCYAEKALPGARRDAYRAKPLAKVCGFASALSVAPFVFAM